MYLNPYQSVFPHLNHHSTVLNIIITVLCFSTEAITTFLKKKTRYYISTLLLTLDERGRGGARVGGAAVGPPEPHPAVLNVLGHRLSLPVPRRLRHLQHDLLDLLPECHRVLSSRRRIPTVDKHVT